MVLARGAEASQAREDDRLLDLQDLLHLGEELRQDAGGHVGIDLLVIPGVQVHEIRVAALLRGEIQPAVGRVDRIALVGKGGGHQFGHETADPGQGHGVMVQDSLLHHFCKQIDIHRGQFQIRDAKIVKKTAKKFGVSEKGCTFAIPKQQQGIRKDENIPQ